MHACVYIFRLSSYTTAATLTAATLETQIRHKKRFKIISCSLIRPKILLFCDSLNTDFAN